MQLQTNKIQGALAAFSNTAQSESIAAFLTNAAIGPQPITIVINAAQSGSVAVFLKTQLQAQSLQPWLKNTAIGLSFSCGYKNAAIDPQGAIAAEYRPGL